MALDPSLKQQSISSLQPNPAKTGSTNTGKAGAATQDSRKLLADEFVTLSNNLPEHHSKTTARLDHLLEGVGKDTLFMKETLRNKVAELRLNPSTRLEVRRDVFGRLQAVGNAPAQVLEKISKDLNNSQAFREAFGRTQQNKPTADYLNNAAKLQQAYGVQNQVYSSVISQKGTNSLDEIHFRYQKLKEVVAQSDPAHSIMEPRTTNNSDFSLVLNA